MFTKLRAINAPAIENVHPLWRDSETNQGMNDSRDAIELPKPNSTSNEGRAQHSSVLSDVKRDK